MAGEEVHHFIHNWYWFTSHSLHSFVVASLKVRTSDTMVAATGLSDCTYWRYIPITRRSVEHGTHALTVLG